jgi:hypothetical protein
VSAEENKAMLRRLLEALNTGNMDVVDEDSNAAAERNDPAAFRAAMKAWERAGLEAIEVARKGAA